MWPPCWRACTGSVCTASMRTQSMPKPASISVSFSVEKRPDPVRLGRGTGEAHLDRLHRVVGAEAVQPHPPRARAPSPPAVSHSAGSSRSSAATMSVCKPDGLGQGQAHGEMVAAAGRATPVRARPPAPGRAAAPEPARSAAPAPRAAAPPDRRSGAGPAATSSAAVAASSRSAATGTPASACRVWPGGAIRAVPPAPASRRRARGRRAPSAAARAARDRVAQASWSMASPLRVAPAAGCPA